jgi:hypothetical protein
MSAPTNASTHFQTAFRLRGEKSKALFQIAQKQIRYWVETKERKDDGLYGKWFFTGGLWTNHEDSSVFIKTCVDSVEADATDPLAWSFYYNHADTTYRGLRYWHTEVGLRKILEDEISISCRVSHALNREYIGPEIIDPSPSCPRFLKDILEHRATSAFSGDMRLHSEPYLLATGDCKKLSETVFSTTRHCPVIIVNGNRYDEYFSIDVRNLQKSLLGKTNVFICPEDSVFGEELSFFFSGNYQVRHRSMRVFLPYANINRNGDARRHRYFSSSELSSSQTVETINQLIASIARTFTINDPESVLHESEVVGIARQRHLSALREAGKPTAEWVKLLEADNQTLGARLDLVKEQLKQSEQLVEIGDGEIQELKQLNHGLKSQLAQLAGIHQSGGATSSKGRDAFLLARSGEGTPNDCLFALDFLFPDRLRILSSAFASSEESAGFQKTKKLWELLEKLATDYYDRLSTEGSGDLVARQVFGNDSFSAKESESVEGSSRLRQRRIFLDRGIPQEMFRHLKIGVADNASETIRVHFDWDAEEKIIVVGHCGPHLPLK